ncbi:MAG: Kelch repeat type 1-containing protein [Segetibacter sp.]|nr:Kelch repeat type 1-containing protein [Segetibacter sp.]
MTFSIECFSQDVKVQPFTWRELPSLPDSFGFAGCFAGISNGALIVAGGANFPDGGAPWTGSKKVWSDKIFVLDKPGGKWKVAGKLPQPLGYGVSVSWNNRLICIGGSNIDGHVASVWAISYSGKKISFEKLPDLPRPLANSCGALLGNVIYIAGGLFKPESTSTANIFWSLDLVGKPNTRTWKQLEPWPGPPRMLAVAGAQNGSFFLFSGADLHTKEGELPQREYLKDAYEFHPKKGWKKLADLPHVVVAAPGPAYSDGQSLMIFGGDDGKLAPQASVLKERHPGFSDEILSYNTLTNHWSIAAKIKTDKKEDAATNPNRSIWAPVTTPMVVWDGNVVLPSGEVRPAIRTPKVMMACRNPKKDGAKMNK